MRKIILGAIGLIVLGACAHEAIAVVQEVVGPGPESAAPVVDPTSVETPAVSSPAGTTDFAGATPLVQQMLQNCYQQSVPCEELLADLELLELRLDNDWLAEDEAARSALRALLAELRACLPCANPMIVEDLGLIQEGLPMMPMGPMMGGPGTGGGGGGGGGVGAGGGLLGLAGLAGLAALADDDSPNPRTPSP